MRQFDYQQYIRKTKQYYDVKFGDADGFVLNREEEQRWNRINKALEQYSINQSGEKLSILDFGCGDGRFTKLLSQYGKVTGVDISEKAVIKAQKKFPEYEFYIADLSSRELTKQIVEKFDVIVSTEVIEHIYDQKSFLENVKKLLSSRGVFILTTPNGKCYRHYFGRGTRQFGQAYEWWLHPLILEEKLVQTGLKVKNRSCFNNDWIFKRKPRSWLRIIGNKYVFTLLKLTGLLTGFKKIFKKMEMGLYLIIVAIPDANEK